MAQTAATLVHHVIPRVPVRWRVLSLPIPLRQLPTSQPKLMTPVLQVVGPLARTGLAARPPVHAACCTQGVLAGSNRGALRTKPAVRPMIRRQIVPHLAVGGVFRHLDA